MKTPIAPSTRHPLQVLRSAPLLAHHRHVNECWDDDELDLDELVDFPWSARERTLVDLTASIVTGFPPTSGPRVSSLARLGDEDRRAAAAALVEALRTLVVDPWTGQPAVVTS